MDEKKDLAVDRLVAEDSAAEAIDDAAEQAVDAADPADSAEEAVDNAEESAPAAEDGEDAAPDAEGDKVEEPVENEVADAEATDADADVAEAEADDAEIAETAGIAVDDEGDAEPAGVAVDDEGDAEPAAPEEPSKPAKKSSSFASMSDLLIVGVLAIIMGVLLTLPSILGVTSGEKTSSGSSGATAATVNGVAISEDEITKYIMDFRSQQGLDSDDAWGEWMVSYGYSPEDLRSDTIDYFVNRALLKQAITEQGIVVDDSKVDEYISSITEQVGGEEAFQKALEQEGLDLDTYRSEILFSLQQQALAEKVAPEGSEVDDAQVLEIVKMYFPDSVDEKATSLDGVDSEIVEQVRSMLKSSALQQAFSQWMDDYRSKAKIVIVEMPSSMPYAIDLSPYEQKAKQAAQDGTLDNSADSEQSGEAIEVVEDSEASSGSAKAAKASDESENPEEE